jgi:uncharacterized membrane protein YgcG
MIETRARGVIPRLPLSYLAPFLVALAFLTALRPAPAWADEGWIINQFDAQIAVQPDGSLRIVETILLDFGGQQKHGIYRDIPVVYRYDDQNDRTYDLSVDSVTDRNGQAQPYNVSTQGANLRIQIGDANRLITGPQSYRISYRVRGALNSFADHDELYWNVNGVWPVRTVRTTATVTLPGAAPLQVACFQGATGSTAACRASASDQNGVFESTRTLTEQEQMTIVVGMRKGLVPAPQPLLVPKERDSSQYFDVTPETSGGAVAVGLVTLGAIGYGWWRFGRDREYATLRYLDASSPERTRPLFSTEPVVVEFKPPDGLRPAQLGLIIDESADPLDVTATIVDLAVRGYLTIADVKKEGLLASIFGGREWELTRTEKPASDLLDYEQGILGGLFSISSPVRLSALRQHFYTYLNAAQKQLYQDAMARKWFAFRPDHARGAWLAGGIALAVVGVFLTMALGGRFGAGLIGVPIVVGGIALSILSHAMPKRTAVGRDVLRRTVGFREYISTAEKDRQRFNEQTNLFSEYLPYAIVFGCVDKWARAFEGIGEEATRGWYYGPAYFSASTFSRDLQGFSSAVSTTIASTPGGSGSSGFSGGSSGGGGGGGGGGSW